MISYTDSEVRIFHPLCEQALTQAIAALGLGSIYEAQHHVYTGSLEMDYVVVNKTTGKYLCVVEVKRTPSDVQSTRYQFQAQSYVQSNMAVSEKPFYIITNLEKLISFRYDAHKPSVHQQALEPGLENVCDFSVDDENSIVSKLAIVFQRLLDDFINNRYTELTTLDDFLTCMKSTLPNSRKWKSKMAVLLYEYIRGAFHAVHKSSPTITYSVSSFAGDVQQICIEANRVDFDGIFAYNTTDYLPRMSLTNKLLSDVYKYGKANISGDSIADSLYEMLSESSKHDGEVATDPELANLAATIAKMINGNLSANKKICDPAAGSGSLISSAMKVFNINGNQVIANDINPKLIELLSLRLGLNNPITINRSNAPVVTSKDILSFVPSDFSDVGVVLLNPPFVAGINSVNRKTPFMSFIQRTKGSPSATGVGQQNLGVVFLEAVCSLMATGTTIACIFPKAQLIERGNEAVAFREMLLGIFGLQCIFNYPGKGLFESVAEETCILVGKKGEPASTIKLFSSDVAVADMDLHALETYAGEYNSLAFNYITSDIEAREISYTELQASLNDGWRVVCSEMSEAIIFIDNNIARNAIMTYLPNTTQNLRKGQVGVNGGSDLLFFDSFDALYTKYISQVTLEEGMRNADGDDFILNTGDSKFLNFNTISSSLSTAIISDYVSMVRPAKQQQRKAKSVTEWEKITKKDGTIRFPANSILLPTKLRRNGRVYVSEVPMYVSTNFTVYSYQTLAEAQVIGSYMTTVFYQLECEVASKDHSGMRKSELRDAKMTHVPDYNALSQNEISQVLSEIPNIAFKDLNNPTITHMDEIWAEILFEANAKVKLEEAIRLQRFLANRRNPLS